VLVLAHSVASRPCIFLFVKKLENRNVELIFFLYFFLQPGLRTEKKEKLALFVVDSIHSEKKK
jgi:hypothetical protein